MTSAQDQLLGQVERIAQSETLRGSESLRRLLRYLAEKSASGEADDLKEYTVGVDGMGRPVTYDPRHDAAARIQVGRLRQKLADYYRTEGQNDHIIVDLPKGHFKLVCTFRTMPKLRIPSGETFWRKTAIVAAAVGLVALIGIIFLGVRVVSMNRQSARQNWTPALQEVWHPFVTSDRPLVMIIADPLFVQFKGFGTYRAQVLNSWNEVEDAPAIKSIRKALKDPDIEPSTRYTGVSEANASFLLGMTLASHVPHISLARASELSWSELANNNIVYVGAERIISERLRSLPVDLEFSYNYQGVVNAHPRAGEPDLFADPTIPNTPGEDGESLALISRIPGPDGQGEMEAFTSNSAPARLAAVQMATSAEGAREIVTHLKGPSGRVPKYFQVLLRVKFHAGVPTETSYVTHRELGSAATHLNELRTVSDVRPPEN